MQRDPDRPTGYARSMMIYHGSPERSARMDRFYASLVQQGDLVFDIGAHVGDRAACFRRLGASVLCAEPQPEAVAILRRAFADDPGVIVEAVALGREKGLARMLVNERNPTVSTLSQDFVARAQGAPGWAAEHWASEIVVPVTTLDDLMRDHGRPAFVKIDVEGFEDQVLAGLTAPVPALSFEFTTLQPEVAERALLRLEAFGCYRFRASLGEELQWAGPELGAAEMRAWIAALPFEANSGDIYAIRATRA